MNVFGAWASAAARLIDGRAVGRGLRAGSLGMLAIVAVLASGLPASAQLEKGVQERISRYQDTITYLGRKASDAALAGDCAEYVRFLSEMTAAPYNPYWRGIPKSVYDEEITGYLEVARASVPQCRLRPGTTPVVIEPLPTFSDPLPMGGFYLSADLGPSRLSSDWTTTSLTSLGAVDPVDDPFKSITGTAPAVGGSFGYYSSLDQFHIPFIQPIAPQDTTTFRGAYSNLHRFGIGGEVNFTYHDLNGDPGIPGTGAIGTAAVRANDSVSVAARYELSLRARLGYQVTPSILAYVAGGPSWLWAKATLDCTAAGVCGNNGIAAFSQTNSTVLTGWTFGGGFEAKLGGHWRGRIEYRHADYGTFSTSFGTPAALALGADIDVKTDSIMFGLIYGFGLPAATP